MVPVPELTFAILGAGGRGRLFSDMLADELGAGCVVAVADPDPLRRGEVAARHAIPTGRQYASWQECFAAGKPADVVVNTTMDRDHLGSSLAALGQGCHMLLEKPMAVTEEDCSRIFEAQRRAGTIVAVCHSLRHNAVFRELRELLRRGTIGDVVAYDQLEAVELIHQSHSFVRGNWGNEGRSAFMLLAKCCHDVDIIADMIDVPCERVSSFGSLTYFREDRAPEGAPKRCTDGCPHEVVCPFSAYKVYASDDSGWSYHAGFGPDVPRDERIERLKTSPYGRCVFRTDNDVVDHQVVAMEFAGGATATLTMTAFTPWFGRYVRVHGTLGYIEARVDQRQIDLWEFWKGNQHTRIEVPALSGSHGGGDLELLRNFIHALKRDDSSLVRTSVADSFASHRIVFAAERSRREGRVVSLSEAGLLPTVGA